MLHCGQLKEGEQRNNSSDMEKIGFLILLVSDLQFGVSSSSSRLHRQYHFVNEQKTWLEARSYCQARYTDLATADNKEEMKNLVSKIDLSYTDCLWIGLKIVDQNQSDWSLGDNTLFQYRNWSSGDPVQQYACGIISNISYTWFPHHCAHKHFALCYSEPEERKKQVVRVKVRSHSKMDLNDPAVNSAILNKIEQNLKEKGLHSTTKLYWREMDNKVFHPEKMTKSKPRHRCSD